MASAWIIRREASDGPRYRVLFRRGGKETPQTHAGSFRTMREARARRDWVAGELAALRIPNLDLLGAGAEPEKARTLRDAAAAWRETRIDVAESTRVLHRVALARATAILGDRRVDEISADDVASMVTALVAAEKKRETIRKTLKYLAAVLDAEGRDPNPARSKSIRLPYEDREEIVPPTAEHVEAVYHLLARPYRLPLLWLDWSGARVGSIDSLLVADFDEPGRRLRLRGATQKTRAPLWVELPEALSAHLAASLGPREDRDPADRLFPDVTADSLRTAIARSCRAAGVPTFSPHDLRHRRISLLHRQGRSWAEIARFVGQRKLSLTADTYTHVLIDGAEVDYAEMLS